MRGVEPTRNKRKGKEMKNEVKSSSIYKTKEKCTYDYPRIKLAKTVVPGNGAKKLDGIFTKANTIYKPKIPCEIGTSIYLQRST